MGALEIVFGIILLIFAVGIVIIVLSQQGEQKNNGVMTGGSSDTYISKNSGRTIDAFLARWTKFFAVGFFLCVIAVNVVIFFVGNGKTADAATTDTNSSVTSSMESGTAESSEENSAESDADASGAEASSAASKAAEDAETSAA